MSKNTKDVMDALVERDEDSNNNFVSLGNLPGWKELRANMKKEREKEEQNNDTH